MARTAEPPSGRAGHVKQDTNLHRSVLTVTEVRTRYSGGQEEASITTSRDRLIETDEDAENGTLTRVLSRSILFKSGSRPKQESESQLRVNQSTLQNDSQAFWESFNQRLIKLTSSLFTSHRQTLSESFTNLRSAIIGKQRGFHRALPKACQTVWLLIKTTIAYPWTFLRYLLIVIALSFFAYGCFVFFCCLPLMSKNYSSTSSLTRSPPPVSIKVENSLINREEIWKIHGDWGYAIRDRYYTLRQMGAIDRRILGSRVSTIINASSLSSREELLQDLTSYISASNSAILKFATFHKNVNELLGYWMASICKAAMFDSPPPKHREQRLVHDYIEHIAPQFAHVNTSGLQFLDSLRSINDHAIKLKAGLAKEYANIFGTRAQIIGNRSFWDRRSCARGFPMTDTLEVETQIDILRTIQPVVAEVVSFAGHLLSTVQPIRKDLEQLIEDTLKLKDRVYNPWYGLLYEILDKIGKHNIDGELDSEGEELGVKGLATACRRWGAFQKSFDQSRPSNRGKADDRRESKVYEALEMLFLDMGLKNPS